MFLDSVVVETTRRCNLRCYHCLRGNAQPYSMPDEHIQELFHVLASYPVGTITFTGGEPSLPSGTRVMEKSLEYAMSYGCEINNVFVATNAVRYRRRFIDAFISWWNFCYENDISHIRISLDRYHPVDEGQQKLTMWRYQEDLEMCGISSTNIDAWDHPYEPIAEGRYEGCSERLLEPEEIQIEGDRLVTTLYLNKDGYVIKGCDFSYKNQKKRENQLCHVTELKEVLGRLEEQIEEDE